jgi:primosomal protein N''
MNIEFANSKLTPQQLTAMVGRLSSHMTALYDNETPDEEREHRANYMSRLLQQFAFLGIPLKRDIVKATRYTDQGDKEVTLIMFIPLVSEWDGKLFSHDDGELLLKINAADQAFQKARGKAKTHAETKLGGLISEANQRGLEVNKWGGEFFYKGQFNTATWVMTYGF